MAVLPTVGAPFPAMSRERLTESLRGLDTVTLLEATSSLLMDVEAGRADAMLARLPSSYVSGWRRWMVTREAEGRAVANTPLHPLAILAAATVALAQSVDGVRSDEARNLIATSLARASVQFNHRVMEARDADHPDSALLSMAMSKLWRAAHEEAWVIWSADLVRALGDLPRRRPILQEFEQRTGLSVFEWYHRTLAERATRLVHGAASWTSTSEVDADLERAWLQSVAVSPTDMRARANEAVTHSRRGSIVTVTNPHNVEWLLERPVVVTPDGRRFSLSLAALDHVLLPSIVASRLAGVTGVDLAECSQLMGDAAGLLLARHIEAVPLEGDEIRRPEATFPRARSKCDYVLERPDVLVGIEFTVSRPPSAIAGAHVPGLDQLLDLMARKVQQICRTFDHLDPSGAKRHLPLLVFGSPNVVDPLLNERVRELLDAGGASVDDSEILVCHAPEFLDLVEWAAREHIPLSEAVRRWHDDPSEGTALDWWLADRNALGLSSKGRRLDNLVDELEPLLTRQL